MPYYSRYATGSRIMIVMADTNGIRTTLAATESPLFVLARVQEFKGHDPSITYMLPPDADGRIDWTPDRSKARRMDEAFARSKLLKRVNGRTVRYRLEPADTEETADPDDVSERNVEDRGYIGEAIAAADVMDTADLAACIRTIRRSPGLRAIALERARQMDAEGYDAAHDDGHSGELAMAAGCYAKSAEAKIRLGDHFNSDTAYRHWPWELLSWKPKTAARDLERSGALVAAELDRLTRAKGAAR